MNNLNGNVHIYRLCRNARIKNDLEMENRKYNLGCSTLLTNIDYFQFLNKIIRECPDDFALVCHDDVVLPINILKLVDGVIEKANLEFGYDSWGIIGNAGVEFLSLKILRYIKDPHAALLSNSSNGPRPVIFIDGNTLLLNIKNLREKSVSMPSSLSGFHLYDFVLLVECYRKELVCAVDSRLYVVHKSAGAQDSFNSATRNQEFLNYWKKLFINHVIFTINGPVNIANDVNYLKMERVEIRKDFQELVYEVLKSAYKIKQKKKLFIITRTTLNRKKNLERFLNLARITNLYYSEEIDLNIILSINNVLPQNEDILDDIKKQYTDLKIKFLFNDDNENAQYPRVYAIKNAVKSIGLDENSFAWIVDDDDFIYPEAFKYLPIILSEKNIFIGNATVFKEVFDNVEQESFPSFSRKIRDFNSKDYFMGIMGENHVPICSAIYPIKVLDDIFSEYKLLGDYYEDYAIFLIAQSLMDVAYYPITMTGISWHGKNTVLEKDRSNWDYSYATFISEIVNSGVYRSFTHELAKLNETSFAESSKKTEKKNILMNMYDFISGYLLYGGQKDVISKAYGVFKSMGVKKTLYFSIQYFKHGRGYFMDGINSIEKYKK